MNRARIFILLLAVSLVSPVSHAVVEETLKARPRPDYTKASELQSDLEEASLDNDMNVAEGASLKGIKNDAVREETMLKYDLQRLENQEGALKTEIETAKKEAGLAQDKVAKQKLVNAEARKRVLKSQKDRVAALEKLAQINEKFRKAQEEEATAIQENQFIALQNGLAEEDAQKLSEHTERVQQSILREKQRRSVVEANLARALAKKKELEAKAQKVEIRAEAFAPHAVKRASLAAPKPAAKPASNAAAAAPTEAQRAVSSQTPQK